MQTKIETGEIVQIIPWEEREKYFDGYLYDVGGIQVDIINVARPEDKRPFKQRFVHPRKPIYGAMWLENNISIAVERPHDFKLGEKVEVQVSIEKYKENNEKQ